MDIDVNQFIDDQYIKKAFQAAGLNYTQQLKNYAQAPLVAKDALTQKPIQSFERVSQVWVKGEAKVRSYASPENAFKDLKNLQKQGKSIRVVYNQDRDLKIKVLANLAWYATDKNGQINAFLVRGNANNWAKAHGGKVYDFNNAQKLVK